ncbi:radical SAM protein [Salidesulfovibrio onnuriiensis]|uniref:radical SAM protein n=1 Tax=Salidesulfovibrio onnuriiensis TaxID=2583823 RepID=UPI0011C74375|nr:radical SAM protein [Salidesulfovibrio onnuriiensis]
MKFNYVFGPVMSGRLGRSLGLDLLGDRICSMDCIYCEVGATRTLTLERRPYVSGEDILHELEQWKEEGHETPDVITLGGLGEPCLNSEMRYVIEGVRNIFPGLPVAVLTNSTLMLNPEVRQDLALADIVLPSLDSLVPDEFQTINRPCPGIGPDEVAQGLLEFRNIFDGRIFLEILLAEGVNDSDANLGKLEAFCKRLQPDRIDVVTLSRPGTVKKAKAVDKETLERWRKVLHTGDAPVRERLRTSEAAFSEARVDDMVRASLARRPQTVEQLSQALGIPEAQAEQAVTRLVHGGEATSSDESGTPYYYSGRHTIEG